MNINWKNMTRNTYTYCKPAVRKYILTKSLAKVQFNNAIRKNGRNTKNVSEANSVVKMQFQTGDLENMKKFSVLSKYNSEQREQARLVTCTCCERKVPGKRVFWTGYKDEDMPILTASCENCEKWLSHYEEDNSEKFLGMCMECYKDRGSV